MKTAGIYEQVTQNIINQLEQGIVPWRSPYFSKVGFPRNFANGKAYQGINVFLLASHRYTSPYFLTFIQARVLGGHVRKGERGSLVVKYGTYSKHGEDAPESSTEEKGSSFLRLKTCRNYPSLKRPPAPVKSSPGCRTRQHSKKEVPSLATTQAATA